ncbi:hypothetical protein BS47DRAFT_879958 [Hydnum rufescens UP504]|uniref:Uncharacterized protein n=1 Tax=Hydnum rufescens UP504 TaxID=1448309 RepID=A0A9P6DXZ6_9AGAM|nr:hypothetical protein BS47DRAFT_879958 [Hydnum rufescens UP504]
MDELRRSRVSLGVSSLQEKENALAAPIARKRAMSIAGTRVVSPRSQARRSLVSDSLGQSRNTCVRLCVFLFLGAAKIDLEAACPRPCHCGRRSAPHTRSGRN